MKSLLAPPDQLQRDAILKELGSTILVEAAAGTGKTTSIVGRMVRLLAAGVATVDRIAAVTFTRKAAAELADRFHRVLQVEASRAAGQEKTRLERAILSLDRCFIGTIHSFCGRLLRERPLEAGLPIDFEEIDEQEDQRIRSRVWQDFVEDAYWSQDPILGRLEDLGLQLEDLAASFQTICDYQDVEEWPAEQLAMPDLEPAVMELEAMVDHIEPLVRDFPDDSPKDPLITVFERVVLAFRQAPHIRSAPQLIDVLSQFKPVKNAPRTWPWGQEQAKAELARLTDFIEQVSAPLLKKWREYRYPVVIEALLSALDRYSTKKLELCKLNFQDLLLYSARMLQKNPTIRKYFKKRYTHILVDEFQDTDPIQAEVLLYITADDPCETDWRKCRPVPGSLFVVGDPKQSIYRFRRADIITYEQVKEIVRESGGRIIPLSANFRTVGPLIDWVNDFFSKRFAEQPQGTSPSYVALQKVLPEPKPGSLCGIRTLRVSPDKDGQRSAIEVDAHRIASIIRSLLDEKIEIPIKPANGSGAYRAVEPGDFLVITPRLKHLHLYAKALQELDIPHEVTGSATVNETEEVLILHSVVSSLVEPHNPVAFLAVLRGPLFGLSDHQLYDFKTKGGVFSFESEPPQDLDPPTAQLFSDAFARMQRYRSWLVHLPMIPALEKIVEDVGLLIHAAVDTGGNLKAGALFKTLEWLRKSSPRLLTANDAREALYALVTKTQTHDAIPAMTISGSAVRLMNLHKVKGLEAPIVFLADPSGSFDKPPLIHIDRSGSKVRGYFAVHSAQPMGNNPEIFAQPVDWDQYAQRESDFQRAEFLRLLYVAATRAGCLLTISQLDKGKKRHPWVMFSDALEEAPEWAGPFQQDRGRAATVPEEIPGDEALRVRAELRQKWECVTRPSYQSSGVKERAVVSDDIPLAAQDQGTQWGTAIHALLEAAMARHGIDLEQAARTVLTQIGMDVELLPSCIDAVQKVMSSRLWVRAKQSRRVMTEIPFQMCVTDSADSSASQPLILKGVIDLVFQEDDGWVLVDYKTDRIPETSLEQFVEKYRGQVLAYAEAWASITQQGVKEKGLYFTHLDSYVVLD
jgi:ATP-dependent helicase/nuclease subunit A